MDRNPVVPAELTTLVVALRKESVDRNVNLRVLDGSKSSSLSARRAWIEINFFVPFDVIRPASLSARRAWIEIPIVPVELTTLVNVALRKESVDRNTVAAISRTATSSSLSARRAWIEI